MAHSINLNVDAHYVEQPRNAAMTKRRLGRSELFIDPIVLGTHVIGVTVDEKTSFEIFDAFLAQGCRALAAEDGLRLLYGAERLPDAVALLTSVNSGTARLVSQPGPYRRPRAPRLTAYSSQTRRIGTETGIHHTATVVDFCTTVSIL